MVRNRRLDLNLDTDLEPIGLLQCKLCIFSIAYEMIYFDKKFEKFIQNNRSCYFRWSKSQIRKVIFPFFGF